MRLRPRQGLRPWPVRRLPKKWAVAGLAFALATGGGYTAYSATRTPAPRPLTAAEADRMALVRLTTYMSSPVTVTVTVDDGGMVEQVRGLVDYHLGHAVGTYSVADDNAPLGKGLIAWDTGGLGVAPLPKTVTSTPDTAGAVAAAARITPAGWSPRAYTTDPLDAALQLVMGLGSDRPDNAQLLAQAGPRWLGADRIDGQDYDIFSGPHPEAQPDGGADADQTSQADQAGSGLSPLTYWIDADGNLRRVRMKMQGLAVPSIIDIVGRRSTAQVPTTPWQN